MSLDQQHLWYSGNRAALNELMAQVACTDTATAPVAVFDWDNTVIKGDIGDGSLFELFTTDGVRRPPSWAATSKHLSAEALASLDTHCPLATLPDPLPTSTNPECLTAILCIYVEGAVWDGVTEQGAPGERCTGAAGWSLTGDATGDTTEPAYAWAVSLQAGLTRAQIGAIGSTAFTRRLNEPVGTSWALGYLTGVDAYIRINDQIRDLIAKMQANGFDVWISSATSESVVAAVAPEHVGVPADHIIGAQAAFDEAGTATYGFAGCGTFADGNQDLINYRLGKRCFINKRIFGVTDGTQQLEQASPIAFAAGDSNTDSFFVRDATEKRLVINRQKSEIMCHAYANTDGNWLVNPLFFEPKDKKSSGYDCSAYGLPNQEDTVFCTGGTYSSDTCSAPLE